MNNQEITRANNLCCPRCRLSHIKKNGHTYYGKQNYQCKLCARQFVIRNEIVSSEKQELIKSLLLERISLRGICRVLKVSLAWLINFIERQYQATPADLQFAEPVAAEIEIFCLEADELWSFVARRENKRWIWLILERRTRQIIALHIGDRSSDSAIALWAKVPLAIKVQALVLTDCWDAYGLAIPEEQHVACEKQSGQVSLIERFNAHSDNEYQDWCERVCRFQRAIGFTRKPLNISSLITISLITIWKDKNCLSITFNSLPIYLGCYRTRHLLNFDKVTIQVLRKWAVLKRLRTRISRHLFSPQK